MKSYELKELNANDLIYLDQDVAGGSRPRLIVRNKSSRQKSLVKVYKRTPRELWAEVYASKIGQILEFDVQKSNLRWADNRLKRKLKADYPSLIPEDWNGLVAQVNYVLPRGMTFNYGSQYIKRLKSEDEAFSLNEVFDAFRKAFPSSDELLGSFARMVVFDYLIGNSDRHSENWAIAIHTRYPAQLRLWMDNPIRKELASLRTFATLFDHGDSAIYEVPDETVQSMLNEGTAAYERYIMSNKASYLCLDDGSSAPMLDVIKEKLHKPKRDNDKWRDPMRLAVKKAVQVNQYEIAKTIAKMPNDTALCYNDLRKDLLLRITQQRIYMLTQAFGGTTT